MKNSESKISKVLVANRGEIACRIIKTLRLMKIKSVAIFSDADKNAMHVKMADESIALDGNTSAETYLNISKILKLAAKAKVSAVHPGYGFLSENPEFASALKKIGIIFIGPSAKVIKLLGDKIESKKLAAELQIPLIPGITVDKVSGLSTDLKKFIKKQGFPLIIKASAGGGGRGMRRVYKEKELNAALLSAEREAVAAFGNGQLFIEKLLTNVRHVEVQIFGDNHGDIRHYFSRDCSAQRNHQKVIEEAPATALPAKLHDAILKAAVKISKACGYSGAGTVEFLVENNKHFYFLECNSRLQVEHPVSEAICQEDLVKLQVEIASNTAISNKQIKPKGHSIECRICAEDPADNFKPGSGQIELLQLPVARQTKSSLRIDCGFQSGDTVSHYYDSLLAKIIAHASTRDDAINQLIEALQNTRIFGIKTNISFLLKILNSAEFKNNTHNLDLCSELLRKGLLEIKETTLICGLYTIHRMLTEKSGQSEDIWNKKASWRITAADQPILNELAIDGHGDAKCRLIQIEEDSFSILPDTGGKLNKQYLVKELRATADGFTYKRNDKKHTFSIATTQNGIWIACELGNFRIKEAAVSELNSKKRKDTNNPFVSSALPGKIIEIKVKSGEQIEEGQTLLLIESMKMEHSIKAEASARIKSILTARNQAIDAGQALIELEFK